MLSEERINSEEKIVADRIRKKRRRKFAAKEGLISISNGERDAKIRMAEREKFKVSENIWEGKSIH